MRRVIGIDIHRTFGEVVFWEEGRLRHGGRIDMTRTALEGFGKSLLTRDEVVIEATGNCMAVFRVLAPFVKRVVIANPLQVKAIAYAHVKTDKVDAGTLASLYAAGYLPEIWAPDADTERMRRLVARRYQVVRHRTRIKNEIHAILHAHLIPKCPHSDLFNGRGRDWLARQPVPDDERFAIARHVRELDRLAEDLAIIDRGIAESALDDRAIGRLLTIAGINLTVATGLMAAIGDVTRFKSPQKLVSYFGLNPRPPVGCRRRPSWPNKQGRAQPCPRDAGGGGLGSGQDARSVARLLCSHPGQAWPSGGRRCRGAQAHDPVLAFAHEGEGLSLGAPGAGRKQDESDGVAGRKAASEGKPARTRLCLQCQGAARSGNTYRRAGGAKLRAVRHALETSTNKVERAGPSIRQGLNEAARRRFQPMRHASPRGRPRTIKIPRQRRKRLSISSVVRRCFQCSAGKS
jgi:transposase